MCKKLKIIIGTLLVTTLVNVNVFAAPIAHLWSDDNLTQSYNRPYYIGNALSGAGLNVSKFVDKTFTKTTFLSKVATPHVLYFNGHGGNNGSNTFLAPPGGGYVYPSDIKSKAYGHYNFVYFAACHTGETSAMANAFSITSSENEAFVGFKNTIKADWTQTMFDKAMFEGLAKGKSVNDSVWNARTETGITNYYMYGNYHSKLEK